MTDAERRERRWRRALDPAILIVGGMVLFIVLLASLFVWSLSGAREHNACIDDSARTYLETRNYTLEEAYFLAGFHC